MRHAAWIGLVLLALPAGRARAEHFDIDLTIEAGRDRQTAHSDTDPPFEGHQPRPVVKGKAGESLVLQFFFTSAFPHGVEKGVVVHYYVAPEKAVGQKGRPDFGKDVVTEGQFVLDFKPKGKVGLRHRLRIDRPGVYLVRVESDHSDSDHEHFAALDLVIE